MPKTVPINTADGRTTELIKVNFGDIKNKETQQPIIWVEDFNPFKIEIIKWQMKSLNKFYTLRNTTFEWRFKILNITS